MFKPHYVRPVYPRRPEAPAGPLEKTSFTFKLTEAQQIIMSDLLTKGNYRPIQIPYTIAAAETDEYKVAIYQSGKCLVQGKGAKDFVQFILEPKVLGQAGTGYEEELKPEQFEAHIGVDESGKGDYFGPLVIAAAYVDKTLAKSMLARGVKDSKNVSSDKRIVELAGQIRKMLGKRFSIVVIGAQAYNRLYGKMKNVNLVLAWGHARAIENILANVPECPRAISDQFGHKHLIEKALMAKGRKIVLQQRHKAESDVAVAAASILAREAFLLGLRKMQEQYHQRFPKGASAQTLEAAKQLVDKNGPDVLRQTAKCHFKTTDAILGAGGMKRLMAAAQQPASAERPADG
ncbi:MAG: ribonuclease HIII [Kiritimatiellae bacterium]|nr:ribonuclease HIII [Kiritimatiellia bacterium]